MCGIIGAAISGVYGFDKKTEDTFYQMLYANALRGDDSTGVIFIEQDSSFGIMKDTYSSAFVTNEFLNSTMGKSMWTQGKAMIGHNRKKTSGAINDANAHPFVVNDNFALVHNGTLYSHKQLADTEVDSEALAIHLAPVLSDTFDLEKFEEAIGKVYGAYAISAYSQKTNSIYLARNDQRPLSYIETKEGVFWASEAPMLWWIAARNGLTLKDVEVKHMAANSLVTIDLSTNNVTVTDYVPKKAQTPVHTTKGTGGTVTTYTPTNTSKPTRISKNGFKLAKKNWLGKSLRFWVDDYLEKNFPSTIADGETIVTLMGETEMFYNDHSVIAEFDIDNLVSASSAITGQLYYGTVADMTFNRKTGHVTFYITDADPVALSIKPSPMIIDAHYIQEKLDAQEKAVLALH